MKQTLQFSVLVIVLLLAAACEKDKNRIKGPLTYWDYPEFITDGLVAYYPMNGNANDSGGNSYHGILQGGVPSVDRFGDTIGTYCFDGINDYIEIANVTDFNGDEGTLCFWIRVPYSDENIPRAILSKADTSGTGYVISVTGSHYYLWQIKDTTGLLESGTDMGADFWFENLYFFLAVTFTGSSTTLYFEGERRVFITNTPDIIFNANDQPIFIGKSLSGDYQYLKGEIDDVLIYDRALTDEEILRLFNWQPDPI